MSMELNIKLGEKGLQHFLDLQADAVKAVSGRFYATHESSYARFGTHGRNACRKDLEFHLEFLRPVLEFGLLQPMVDYLCWLNSVLTARNIPVEHLALSLEWLAEFFAVHMNEADSAVVTKALGAAQEAFLQADPAEAVAGAAEPWPESKEFLKALLNGKQHQAMAIVLKCIDSGHMLVDVELHVIQAALYQIGEKWQANQITVAQEHLATEIVKTTLTAALLMSIPTTPNRKKVLLACVEGNHHEIGLRMVADAFHLAGWEVQFLGANVPTRALVCQVADSEPHLVGLSISFIHQIHTVQEVIAQLDERLGSTRPAVIVGGHGIHRTGLPDDLTSVVAHAADASAAVAYANQLVRKGTFHA